MKLVITLVTDVESKEAAAAEHNFIEERFSIVSAKLDGRDWHPALEELQEPERC